MMRKSILQIKAYLVYRLVLYFITDKRPMLKYIDIRLVYKISFLEIEGKEDR